MKNNRVVCAAMKMKDGLIVTGTRHYSPEMREVLKRLYPDKKYNLEVAEQGFIDTQGNFLNRKEAWELAEKNGQILYQVSTPGTLYSENLY